LDYLAAEPDLKLGLARRGNINRVSGSLFELAMLAGEYVMRGLEVLTTSRRYATVALCLIGGAAVLIGGSLTIPTSARATPVFAGQTGLPCTRCHTAPTGGKALTDFGKDFQANGNKLKKQ
jgi:hypothetical protein